MRSVYPWIPPGNRVRTILTLAGPIMGGMASQNLLNLGDTAMVGRLGAPALAAVGTASFANFMGGMSGESSQCEEGGRYGS